jgi:insertion element IS1 protein InsB
VIGKGIMAAQEIYRKVKELTSKIEHIYSDANSCYDVAFRNMGIPEPHTMTKAQTHMIEATNSSIRDNLARFNRKSKRYSKQFDMLEHSLSLFLHYKSFCRRIN